MGKDKLIREHVDRDCIVRSKVYDRSLGHVVELFEAAKRDFPDLDIDPAQVEVVHYAGSRYAKTRGIEFRVPEGTEIPESYTEVRQKELYY